MNRDTLLEKMADVDMPAPPDWTPAWLIVLTGITLVTALILYIYARRIRRPHRNTHPDARQAMQQTQQQWRNGEIDARETAYRITTILRLHLGLPALSPDVAPAGIHQHTWREMITLLSALRYKKNTADHSLNETLFDQAHAVLAGNNESGAGP